MGYDFDLNEAPHTVHPVHDREAGDGFRISVDGGPPRTARLAPDRQNPNQGPGAFVLEIGDRREPVFVVEHRDTIFIHWQGRPFRIEAVNALERARRAAEPTSGDETLRAPMPGTVVEVSVQAEDHATAGTVLLTIESMKLQTAITAEYDAHVAEVYLTAGSQFEQGDALVRLERRDESQSSGDESS